MSNYQKSEKHIVNVLAARELALISSQKKKQERIEKYNSNPKLCATCQEPIAYDKRINKFCSKSCSAKLNNLDRKRTEESKQKVGKSIINYHKNISNDDLSVRYCQTCNKEFYSPITIKLFCSKICSRAFQNRKIEHTIVCKVCNKEMTVLSKGKRKTCSRECQIHASIHVRPYINGSRANHYYFNKNENKTILLESSWEVKVAERLDELNINWIRSKPIKWIDEDNKNRLYYPDFYLPKYNLYLDPKNPYAQKVGKYKLECVSKLVNLKFGLLPEILDYIETLDKIDI